MSLRLRPYDTGHESRGTAVQGISPPNREPVRRRTKPRQTDTSAENSRLFLFDGVAVLARSAERDLDAADLVTGRLCRHLEVRTAFAASLEGCGRFCGRHPSRLARARTSG